MIAKTGKRLLITTRELAVRLGVSVRHVQRLDSSGQLPAPVRIGRAKRWRLEEISDWIEAGAPSRREWRARKGVRT